MASLDGESYTAGDEALKLDLKQEYTRVMNEELKLNLLETLKKKGLTTRDIMSFAKNQADNRQYLKGLDKNVSRLAMTNKIKDCRMVVSRHIKRRNELKEEYLRRGGMKHQVRRIFRSTKREHCEALNLKKQKAEKKIEHLQKIQSELEKKYINPVKKLEPTKPPERLKDFSELSIFGLPEALPRKQTSLGPYLCDKNIHLSEGELSVLSKDPKYSLLFECTEDDFETESERSLAKHRYGVGIKQDLKRQGKKKESDSEVNLQGDTCERNNSNGKKDRVENLEALWQESKHRHIFDPFEKIMNFRYRRPTDYKLNTRVKLPRPLSLEEEFNCETRRRIYKNTFDEYKTKIKGAEKEGMKINKEKKNKNGRKRGGKKRKARSILNMTETEKDGHDSLLGRIKDGEIVIVPTDKSGRLSVMTRTQYMKAGGVHTSKDEQIDWDTAKYLKNQVNSHMWWLSRIVSYAKNTDQERMQNNLTVSGIDIPEMSLLVKDHKPWQEDSGKPVPTRPVVSGNVNINTHLSELLSEILEPVALELEGYEVQSSEEALAKIDELNKYIRENGCAPKFNELDRLRNLTGRTILESNMAADFERTSFDINNENISCVSGVTDNGGELDLNSSRIKQRDEHDPDLDLKGQLVDTEADLMGQSADTESDVIIDTLADLGREAYETGNEYVTEVIHNEMNVDQDEQLGIFHNCGDTSDHVQLEDKLEMTDGVHVELKGKSKITDYFDHSKEGIKVTHTGLDARGWLKTASRSARNQFTSGGRNMNKKLLDGMKAARLWDAEQQLLDKERSVNAKKNSLQIQDDESKPIFFGSDVVALYPNLDPTCVAKITANAVKNTKVQFKGINYYYLIVYIFLVLGVSEMNKMGLSNCIPKKKKRKDNNIKSLAAENNRDLENWEFEHIALNRDLKVQLISTVVQIMVLLLTSTTCYKFAGRLFRQVGGLGIGLRASAALARVTMCVWDMKWGLLQSLWGLSLQIFFRYVDDLRMYMKPIKKGWRWVQDMWKYCEDDDDTRSPEERTIEEVGKCLNSTWEFLSFTTEGERDFNKLMLPTLDFETRVEGDGYITYQFYSKPMRNNLVLEYGTALSSSCVFSSLRQDLVRRMFNTDLEVERSIRIKIIEDFIQQMVNSGHRYQYIKAVVLQAVSKYLYMIQRSNLPCTDTRFSPIHRSRSFKVRERLLLKYTNQDNWYSGVSLKDPFRNGWKAWIKRKSDRRAVNKKKRRGGAVISTTSIQKKTVTTAFFVPPTVNGKLAQMIQEKEDEQTTSWTAKIIEKPGIPIALTFKNSFEMEDGCSRGEECFCKNTGKGCTPKRAVYQAQCSVCKSVGVEACYIGESARQVGERVREHMLKALSLNKKSFIVDHWMEKHPLDTSPPSFEYKVLSVHRDPLSRQLREAVIIGKRGLLNKKNEFGLNELIRLDAPVYSWDQQQTEILQRKARSEHENKICDFVTVMLNVSKKCDYVSSNDNNREINYRLPLIKCIKRSREGGLNHQQGTKRNKMMHTSTPRGERHQTSIDSSDLTDASDTSVVQQDTDSGISQNKITNISGNMGNIELDEGNTMSLVQVLTDKIVQVDNFLDSSEDFTSRQSNNYQVKGCQIKSPAWKFGDRPLMEMEVSNGSTKSFLDLSPWDGSDKQQHWCWSTDEDLGLQKLFHEMVDWEEVYIGITDLFDERYINQHELEENLNKKRTNQLYSIFNISVVNTQPIKRKISPGGVQCDPKTRRMSVDQFASPSLRPRINNFRSRAVTISSPSLTTRVKKVAKKRLLPGQKLLPGIWAKPNTDRV